MRDLNALAGHYIGSRSTRRRNNSHTPSTDADFRVFARRVRLSVIHVCLWAAVDVHVVGIKATVFAGGR